MNQLTTKVFTLFFAISTSSLSLNAMNRNNGTSPWECSICCSCDETPTHTLNCLTPHTFHTDCLSRYFGSILSARWTNEIEVKCPICRRDISDQIEEVFDLAHHDVEMDSEHGEAYSAGESDDEIIEPELVEAAQQGDVATVQRLLDAGADVNTRGYLGRTVLIAAVIERQEDVIRLLLTRGADPRLLDEDGDTAIDYAYDPALGQLLLTRAEELAARR